MSDVQIEFVDELPKVHRTVESGVWVERLAPLREQPGRWAKVYGPTNSPSALVNSLRNGNAAGIDPDDFEFAGRNLPTGETETVYDEETGEEKEVGIREGYVFARFLDDELKEERDRLEAEKEAKKAEKEAAESEEDAA